MKKRQRGKYFAIDILKKINLSGDINEISKYENMLSCIYLAPIMFLSAILNFVLRFLVWHENIISVVLDTLILCSFGIMLEMYLRINLKTKLFAFLVASVFCMYFVFLYIRYQKQLGPLLWIIACLQLILVISHVTRDAAIYNGIIILAVSIDTFIKSPDSSIQFNRSYYGIQLLLISIFILAIIAVNHIHCLRFKIIKEQLDTVVKQKQEITSQLKDAVGAREELRIQNETLHAYNIQIIKNEEELKYLAYHDMLTDLPNRKMIYESFENLINAKKDSNCLIYVVFIDIDYFKNINDTLGHHVGDIFITEAAKRLKSFINKDDLLGRTGGDEFSLIINRSITTEEVYHYLETIRDKFSEPFIIHNTVIQSTASFGISVFPKDGEDVITLMRKSDLAMYKAKELGKNRIQYFKQDI